MDPNTIDLEELSNTKPELAEAIKALIAESNGPGQESLMLSKGKSTRFSLNSLHPNVAEVLKSFDFDGNGKVTVDEVHRGAALLKETKKRNKIAMWALVIQFLVYAALTAAGVGVLYHFIYLLKDTTVDPSTGNLMVKSNDASADDLEVSVTAHGQTFYDDGTVIDPVTGEEKTCMHSDKAMEMFQLVSTGTDVRVLTEDSTTGAIVLDPITTHDSATWTDESIQFGEVILVPDEDCTALLFVESGESSEDGTRALSTSDLVDANRGLRKLAVASLKNGVNGNDEGRQLWWRGKSNSRFGYSFSDNLFRDDDMLKR